MLTKILDFVFGIRCVELSKEGFVKMSNLMMKHDIVYKNVKKTENGFSFIISEREYKKLISLLDADSVPLTLKRKGIPELVFRYRKRYGILVGAVIMAALTYMSTMYVWDIRVEGNESISDAEIISCLESLGFGVGSNIKKTDFHAICHELLLLNDGLSWVSVNMEGTGATVKVMERDKKGENVHNGTPSNLLAAYDGEIVRTEIESGQLEISAGQTVKAGELLVNGVVKVGQGDSGRFVLRRSKGKVFAKVNIAFKTEIPLNSQKTVLKETVMLKKSVKFFSKTLNLKENSSISGDNCVIINKNRRIVLFENQEALQLSLPITVITQYAQIYEDVDVSYTEEEALKLAESEMSKQVNTALKEAELLSKNDYYEIIDGVLVLTWEISCITDIASESPIGLV